MSQRAVLLIGNIDHCKDEWKALASLASLRVRIFNPGSLPLFGSLPSNAVSNHMILYRGIGKKLAP